MTKLYLSDNTHHVMLESFSVACMRKARHTIVENVRWLGTDGSIAVIDPVNACPSKSIRDECLTH